MEKTQNYALSSDEFEKVVDLANFIYHTMIVLDLFCSEQMFIEELRNISPIVEVLRHKADVLNAIFINKSEL